MGFSLFKKATAGAVAPQATPTEWAPQYTSDWFSHNTPAWTRFFHQIGWNPESPTNTGIEIGSYEGRSAAWLLEHQFRHPASKLICVDVFADADAPDSYYRRFQNNVEVPGGSRIEVYKGFSFDFLSKFVAEGNRVDFVYVDGSHRAADVLEDLILGFRALNPGGLMICDDYMGGTSDSQNLTLHTPKIAVDAFTNIYRDRLDIFGWQPINQCAMTKKIERNDDDPSSRGV